MPGAVLRIRFDLRDQPEVIAIGTALGMDVDLVVGKLVVFWGWWCNSFHGESIADTKALTLNEIDSKVAVPGFASELLRVGWLDLTEDGLEIPEFDRWLAGSGKTTAAERQRRYRQRKKAVAESNPTLFGSNEVLDPIVIDFPTKEGIQWPLTQSGFNRLVEAFPGQDVMVELRRARLWLDAHPNELKTKRGMLRYLLGWLTRAPKLAAAPAFKEQATPVQPAVKAKESPLDLLERIRAKREEQDVRRS